MVPLVVPGHSIGLIIGLGNPGAEYERTRHNVGFWFVDEIARRHGGAFRFEARHQGEVARVRIGAAETWLLKPMTYMNRSGGPAQSVANFYKIAVHEVLVAYDELDFPPGTVRLKQGGGAAGHNGIRDLIAQLGQDFWRLRIGIGKPPREGIEHVLNKPSGADEKLIREAMDAGAEAIAVMLEDGASKAMNRLHASNAE